MKSHPVPGELASPEGVIQSATLFAGASVGSQTRGYCGALSFDLIASGLAIGDVRRGMLRTSRVQSTAAAAKITAPYQNATSNP